MSLRLKISHRLAKPQYFDYWNNFTMSLRYDAVGSTFEFDYYFDPTNQEHAELFAVSHFHEAIVEYNGETLVTGFILSQGFRASQKKELSKIGGYSKTGVFEDCEIPPSLYPLQTDGLSLQEIANRLAAPFKLKVKVDPEVVGKMSKSIKSITVDETDKIKDVLTKLSIARKIVVTHNESGDLVFTEAKTKKAPILEFSDGLIGTSIDLIFDGQKLHSDITVVKEASSEGGNAGEYTIENPFVPVAYTYRPRVVKQGSGDDTTTQDFAMQTLKAELKDAIRLIITTDRWQVNGNIIKPNNIVNVYSPENFIYKTTPWFIEEVTYKGNKSETTAVIKCVLPTCYDDSIPKNVFVDAHENFPRFNYTKNPKNRSVFST